MYEFTMRSDDVEITGLVVGAWLEPGSLAGVYIEDDLPAPRWCLMLQLSAGDPHLISAGGHANPLDRIACFVSPPRQYLDSYIGELDGSRVRLCGSWGDLTQAGGPAATVIWPVSWVVLDRGIAPIVEENGFTQAVRDLDVFAFTESCPLLPLMTAPPHHDEDRHLEIRVPFPQRPQPAAVPVFTDCVDREDRERQLYFGRGTPQPRFPVFKDRQHSYAVEVGADLDTLVVSVDTGATDQGQGFFYTKIAMTYDEGFDKMCLPDVCLTDPASSCQATGAERFTYVWPRFPAARAGDLILGPAGPNGVLGRLLGALHRPQYYDHMGLFVENDGATIRHCTASDDRLQAEEYFNGEVTVTTPIGSMVQRLPLRGLREDVLKYAWPGSITQTVGEVCLTGRNRSNAAFSFATLYPLVIADEAAAPPKLWMLDPDERDKRTCFHDPEAVGAAQDAKDAGRRRQYSLVRLQKESAWRPELDPDTGRAVGWLPPVIVQPHPWLAKQAYQALDVVAAQARDMNAHYRFYAYSRSDIAENPAYDAPGLGAWGVAPGADWAAGSMAAVCSTFVWAAVRRANPLLAAAGQKTIVLEGEPEPTDHRDPAHPDGLYRYTQEERTDAGKALHEFTHTRVADQVQKKVDKLPAIAGAAIDTLALLGSESPTDRLKAYLGAVVANQLCNTFASDATADLTETWGATGDGIAVSPDDTMLRWDTHAPADTYPPTRPGVINVYGFVVPAVFPRPAWRREPVYRVLPTAGLGTIRGFVTRRANPQRPPDRVPGATVRFGCQVRSTNEEGQFAFTDVKTGSYYLDSSMFVIDQAENVGLTWSSSRQLVDLQPGEDINVDLELEPPPGVARDVRVTSHHDIVDRRVIGKDDWNHFDLGGNIELAYDPLDVITAPPDQRNTHLDNAFEKTSPEVGSGVHVYVHVAAHLVGVPGPGGSIHYDGSASADITLVFYDAEEGETNATVTELGVLLAPGAEHTMPYNEVSPDTLPERASGWVTISNVPAALV